MQIINNKISFKKKLKKKGGRGHCWCRNSSCAFSVLAVRSIYKLVGSAYRRYRIKFGCFKLSFFLKKGKKKQISHPVFLCGRTFEKKNLTALEVPTVHPYYCFSYTAHICANTNCETSKWTPELLQPTDRWSSCATITSSENCLHVSLERNFSENAFSPHIFSSHLSSRQVGGTKTEKWRKSGCNKVNRDVPRDCMKGARRIRVTPIVSSGIFLSLRAPFISRGLLNWFCWLDLLHSHHHHFSAFLQLETWMDFYSRNHCVAKAHHGILLGDVFIKPPIDPGWVFPLVLKKSPLFKTEQCCH